MKTRKGLNRKSWDQRLPRFAWAVVEDTNKLAVWNAYLPLFWLRHVARRYNDERMNGTGHVVKVWIGVQIGRFR